MHEQNNIKIMISQSEFHLGKNIKIIESNIKSIKWRWSIKKLISQIWIKLHNNKIIKFQK